ncbi:MAG TPA: serine hydrolase domain-containing protein [Flavisolibacter sp.]|nr:serine hydrolase domain-containing protein [Flavisolibacter sp.]
MKTCVFTLCLAVCLWSCQSSANKIEAPKKDSLISVEPAPSLAPAEYKKYHDLVSNFVERNLSERRFNGGILVAKNGVPVYERYSGFSNLRTKDSLTAETPLQIASTGKTLTAAAILKLVQEGKLSLSDSVNKWWPNFPYPETTVKSLLNHRSGLPNYLYYMEKMGWNRRQPATNEDILRTLIEWHPPRSYAPDKHFHYNNTNYVILALIIEKVSGVPYPQYMKDNFFVPLKMNNTFVKTQADSASVVYSYQFNGALWPPDFSDGPYGDKNIYSTCRDLLKWDQALYDGRIIKQPLLDSAFTPYSNEKPGIKNYGLGWHLLMLPNHKKVIFHNGRWHGFNSAFARLTDEHVTIIMTCNKMNMGVYQISKKMYTLFGPYDGRSDEPGED